MQLCSKKSDGPMLLTAERGNPEPSVNKRRGSSTVYEAWLARPVTAYQVEGTIHPSGSERNDGAGGRDASLVALSKDQNTDIAVLLLSASILELAGSKVASSISSVLRLWPCWLTRSGMTFDSMTSQPTDAVSYTHLTLPTNREV